MASDPLRPAIPHPREAHGLVGQDKAAGELRIAAESGRLHHAWLLGGPEGIGKATLAYRFARWLLAPDAERRPSAGDGFGVDPAGRTARQIAAGAHPNLVTLERPPPDGEKVAPKSISADAVRRALTFFGSTAADGGRRICVIDSVEDLSSTAANALLKSIEEPPAGGLVLLVSHAPQRVLATVRSRCRKLALPPVLPGDIAAVLTAILGEGASADGDRIVRASELAEGSVARAFALLDPKRLALIEEVRRLLEALPDTPPQDIVALAERVADRRHEAEFGLALDAITHWIEMRVEAGQTLGAARLAPLAELCEKVAEAARALEIYNLDRRAFVVSTLDELAHVVRRTA